MLMERLPGAPLTDVQGADHSHVLRQVGHHHAAQRYKQQVFGIVEQSFS